MLTRGSDFPVLLRGALAYGEVQHLASVFTLERREAVNLAGQAVVEAVRLAEAPRPGGTKPKGPRLWITPSCESEIRTRASRLADWLLAGSDDEPTEVLWLLPVGPERFAGEEEFIKDLCRSAFTLLGKHGNAPQYGDHYVEFARLVVRSLQRVKSFEAQGVTVTAQPLQSFAPLAKVREAFASAGNLPDAVKEQLLRDVEALAEQH